MNTDEVNWKPVKSPVSGTLTPQMLAEAMTAMASAQPYAGPQMVVHPLSYAWARNPHGRAPSVEALDAALILGTIDKDHPDLRALYEALRALEES